MDYGVPCGSWWDKAVWLFGSGGAHVRPAIANPFVSSKRSTRDYLAKAYTEAIRSCADTLRWQHVHVLLDEFTTVRGKQLDVILVAAAIKVLGKAQQWRQGLVLLQAATAQRLAHQEVAYTAAQAACSRSEAWQQALALLPDFLFNVADNDGKDAVYAAAIRACDEGSQWQAAVDLLTQMKDCTLQPSLVARNAAMRACSLRWDVVLEFFARLTEEELRPDEVTFGTAIAACKKDGQWASASFLLSQLVEQGLPGNHDIIAFNSAICASGQCAEWEQSLSLLSLLQRKRLRADMATWISAATSCERADAWAAAIQLLVAKEACHFKKDAIVYNTLIASYGKGEHWQTALAMFAEMQEQNMQVFVNWLKKSGQAEVLHWQSGISGCGLLMAPLFV
ncbi:unnamed protein product [Symbiodinium natans]|uniref:Pentatricopeptide repeat-containing protein, chloroplastic n=1 Tax=Symbiodinium natans TaxID=878477 RepID=A0A812TEX5_9DINO|nr:unnamed protein product [Symbiodinium natans]